MADLYTQLQDARRAHRHAAHVYSRTKNTPLNKPAYEQAVEELEKAALLMALLSAQWGLVAGCAAPAHPTKEKWLKDTDPDPKIIPSGLHWGKQGKR